MGIIVTVRADSINVAMIDRRVLSYADLAATRHPRDHVAFMVRMARRRLRSHPHFHTMRNDLAYMRKLNNTIGERA